MFPALTLFLVLACSGGDSTAPETKQEIGPPASVLVVSGDAQSARIGAGLGAPLVARVSDASGQPVPNATVTWSVASGGGSLSAASTVTNAQGQASVTWKLGTAPGEQVARATAGTASASFRATATVAEAVTPTITAPARLSAGTTATASISAQDHSTYAWGITGGEILSGATSTEITFRSSTAGPIGLTATVTNAAGSSAAPGQATVTSFTTLTTILSGDVTGSPAAGVTEHDTPAHVAYAYSPTQGAASVVAEVDGVSMASSGQIAMDRHRTVYAYGQPSTGTSFSDVIVVPTDPALVPYPSFYASRPAVTALVADPYCGVISPTATYPKSYLGAFPLPETTGAPLAGSTMRGVALKDYWAYVNDNPATNDGCSYSWHAAVDESMRRVKQLGADHVSIYLNAMLKDANATPLEFDCVNNVGCPSWAQMPDSELLWAADRARAHGLKLHLYLQVDVHDINNAPLPTAPTEEYLNRYFDAYTKYMVHVGGLAQQAGIPVMQVDWGVWWIDWTKPEYKPIYQKRMAEVATEVRKVYSGKRALGVLTPWASDDEALMNQVDLLILELWQVQFRITDQDNASLTPDIVRQRTQQVIQDYGSVLGRFNKPAIFRIMMQSHRDYLRHGWIEDGFCTAGCPQRDTKVDFSVQAIGFQGQLEAVKSQSTFPVAAVDMNGYWFADVILPKESFPNLSQSFRNKPAESVVYEWFKR